MRYVDLSHTIVDGMITYQGLPAPLICDFLSRENSKQYYEEEASFQIGQIEMVGNTGTYMDCPFHRFDGGRDFSELFLSDLADLPGILVKVPHESTLAVDVHHFKEMDLQNKAVLIYTGWDRFWRTDTYFENHPFVTAEAAVFLKEQGVKMVGIDSHNIDDTRKKSRPVHTTLLGSEILIIEHMCQLHLLPKDNFLFTAVPPKIKSIGSFPVRAFAKF